MPPAIAVDLAFKHKPVNFYNGAIVEWDSISQAAIGAPAISVCGSCTGMPSLRNSATFLGSLFRIKRPHMKESYTPLAISKRGSALL